MPRKTTKTVEETQVADTTAANEETVQEGQGPQLTLADVKNAVNVIDYAANQGSFKGWEVIGQVMQVRQRLAAFVEAASPKVEGDPVNETTGSELEPTSEEAASS